jgi:hypothetical protein
MAIGDVNVIAEVTQTLTDLLSGLTVTLDSPADLKSDNGEFQKINLFLYQVQEHGFTKNQPPYSVDAGTQQMPPLTLRLYYLLTPYASDPASAHKVLGHAMQIFYDNGLVAESKMTETLRLATDKLAIVLLSAKLEDLTRIWNALQTPYRLSVCYEVRVVPIESTRQQASSRVTSKIDTFSQIG